jgi:hypothetical protein
VRAMIREPAVGDELLATAPSFIWDTSDARTRQGTMRRAPWCDGDGNPLRSRRSAAVEGDHD